MKEKIMYYLNVFLVYSVLGFIMETTLKYLFFPRLNNGFLYGPWIPIYGLGCCLIIAIMRFVFNRIKISRWVKIILVFLLTVLILTTLEFIGGNLIELITGKVFWDYSDLKFNYGNYISLEISLCWGAMSLVVIYLLKPILDKLIKKLPSYVTYLVLVCFFIDLVITILKV